MQGGGGGYAGRRAGEGAPGPSAAFLRGGQKTTLSSHVPAVLYAWHATRGAASSGSHWKRTVIARGPPTTRIPPTAVKRQISLPANRIAHRSVARVRSPREKATPHLTAPFASVMASATVSD